MTIQELESSKLRKRLSSKLSQRGGTFLPISSIIDPLLGYLIGSGL